MADRTLWTNKEAKFKPRNLQAALICRKAKEIFKPVEPPTPNVLVQREAEKQALKERAIQAAADIAKSKEQQREREEADREQQRLRKKNKGPKAGWLAKHLKRQAKLRRGPPPSSQEIRAAKKDYLSGNSTIG